jgi:hypothetical protein
MTIRRFYQMSLFLPLFLPLLVEPGAFVFGTRPGLIGLADLSPRYDAVLLAVSYLGLVYFACRWMRTMSEPEMVKLSLRAPLLFAGLTCLAFLPIMAGRAFTGASSVPEAGGALLGVGLLALFRAAGYTLLVNGVLFLSCNARLVRLERRVTLL